MIFNVCKLKHNFSVKKSKHFVVRQTEEVKTIRRDAMRSWQLIDDKGVIIIISCESTHNQRPSAINYHPGERQQQ